MNEYIDVSLDIASRVSRIHKTNFHSVKQREEKDDGTVVMEVDKKSDEISRDILSERFPNHNIITEEGFFVDNNSDKTWIIDPLDGSVNFSHGVPTFKYMISLVEDEPIMGLIYDTYTDCFVYAYEGEGAFFFDNGNKIDLTEERDFDPVVNLICMEAVYSSSVFEAVENLDERVFDRGNGCAGHSCQQFLLGNVDVQIMKDLSIWDEAPIYAVTKEAGHSIKSLEGNTGWDSIQEDESYISSHDDDLMDRIIEEYNHL